MTRTQNVSDTDQQTNKQTNKQTNTAPTNSYHIIKTSSCDALSGGSTLDYEIGSDSNKQLHIRITSNSGGGFFSSECVSLKDIQGTLNDQPNSKRITSVALSGLFKGRSVNSHTFLMATLKAERFIKPSGNLKRFHECADDKTFKSLTRALISIK
ncbi:MAG TPA: hypothetical protein EYG50_02860 [Cycloclasticus sp.]|jgi:hypothetical protein|nr:hypothetical protein [Cycloclasticus sp.]